MSKQIYDPAWERYGFDQRDEFLKTIGFMSYPDYLASDLWGDIRNRLCALDCRPGFPVTYCTICSSRVGLCWHHVHYAPSVMVGNFHIGRHASRSDGGILKQEPVIRLCNECHMNIHHKDGKWIPSIVDINRRMTIVSDFVRSEFLSIEEFEKHLGDECVQYGFSS
jgi:hypothetical protein